MDNISLLWEMEDPHTNGLLHNLYRDGGVARLLYHSCRLILKVVSTRENFLED